MADAGNFFEETNEPARFKENQENVKKFIDHNDGNKTPIVLVTSGGTTVPLEDNTVRFIDNFSTGARGSASAEYFLDCGYAVIFLHRARSLEPFVRHISAKSVFDMLEVERDGDQKQLKVSDSTSVDLVSTVEKYKCIQKEGRLMCVEFTSLSDYLHLLRACSALLADIGNRAMLYLAAAVSDFYIPKNKMAQHKIQSSGGPLQLSLELVPKMLGLLVEEWVPSAFVVSFKLETDPKLLIRKAKTALEKYKHQVVIGNLLDTRKREVVMVTPGNETWIQMDQAELDKGVEIEQYIIRHLVDLFSSSLSGQK